jgi:hypothetical protein
MNMEDLRFMFVKKGTLIAAVELEKTITAYLENLYQLGPLHLQATPLMYPFPCLVCTSFLLSLCFLLNIVFAS